MRSESSIFGLIPYVSYKSLQKTGLMKRLRWRKFTQMHISQSVRLELRMEVNDYLIDTAYTTLSDNMKVKRTQYACAGLARTS